MTKCSVLLLVGAAWLVPGGLEAQALEPAELRLLAIDDSVDYVVYSYSATNPAASSWSIGRMLLDVGATSGTPAPLSATGEFLDFSASHISEPRAQIGPITPTGWLAILARDASLLWAAPEDGVFAIDSIAPGTTLTGFGMRSTYLPAIRQVKAEPTWQSCCISPAPGSLENPRTSQFAVSSHAIVPGYLPEEITIGLLQNQLNAICSDPLWLDDGPLCTEFSDLLFQALFSFITDDAYSAAATLANLRDRVDAEQAQMEPEAFWLLYYNVRQAYWNVAPPLKVECTPATVDRGAAVTCVPTPPPGVPFEITGWRFVGGSGGGLEVVTSGTPPASWNGAIAADGTVSVYALVDSMADTAATVVQVTPRTWPGIAIANPIPEQDQAVVGDMPLIPESEGDLAHYHNRYASGLSPQDSLARFSVISGGPNADLVYFSGPILQNYNPFTEINRDALTDDQNQWYLSHPASGNTGGVCRQRELERGVLEYFEDRMVEAVDSVEAYWPQSTLQTSIEALVSPSMGAQATALSAAVSAEGAQVDSVLAQIGGFSPPCTLLF